MLRSHKNSGFTLIELLLSMVFGLIVLAGVLYVYIAVIVSTSSALKSSKLNSQLLTTMSVMVNDIRRAGYWAYNLNDASAFATVNPFNQEGDTAIEVILISGNVIIDVDDDIYTDKNLIPDGDCIVYSYDADEDGEVSASEYFGFRLNQSKKVVEMRISGVLTDGDNCNTGVWEELTEPDIYQITKLTFNPKNSACANSNEPNDLDDDGDGDVDEDDEKNCYQTAPSIDDRTVETREIKIILAGQLTHDSFVTFELEQNVRVRNDLVRRR